MIAVLAALALSAAQAPPDTSPPPPDAGVSAPVPPAADAAGDDASSLETLRQVYQTSCADRDFYTFSDVCEQLRIQVHAAEVAADRAARKKAKAPKTTTPPV